MTSFKASFDWGTQAFRETRVTPEPSWIRAGQLYGCVPLQHVTRQVVIYMYESVIHDLDVIPFLVSSFRFASCVALVVINPSRKRVSVSHLATYSVKDMTDSTLGLVSGMLEPLLAAMRSHPEEELHAYVSHGFPATGRDYILPAIEAFPNVRVTTGGGFAQLEPVRNGAPKNPDTYRTCLHVVMSAAAVDVFSLLLPEALVDTARGHEFAYGRVPAGWELRIYDRAIMPELRRGVGDFDFDWDLYASTVMGRWAANPQLEGGCQQPGPFHLIRMQQIPDAAALEARRKVFARAWMATQNPAVMALPSRPRERGLVAIQPHAAGATVFQDACVLRAAADPTYPTAGLTACWSLTREVAQRPHLSEELLQQFPRATEHMWDAEDEAVCRRLSAALGSNWTPARLQKLYAVVTTINLAAVPPPRMDEAGQDDPDDPDCPGWVFQVGIYRRLSFINHSCAPNCRLDIAAGDGTITVKALRDVQAGEPLTISYLGIDRTQCSSAEVMRDLLRAQYGFDCACDACR